MEWMIFFAIITTLLILDLGVFNKKDKIITPKKSLLLTVGYFSVGLFFGLYILLDMNKESAAEYYTGFLIEKTLSLDNIFLISVIFSSLSIPEKYQHRVLFWGIVGVIILRGILIYLGAHIVKEFAWIMYIFGGILVLTGLKMLLLKDKPFSLEDSKIFSFFNRNLPLTNQLHGNKFFIFKDNKKILFTPLFLALVMIELCDLIFAIDSVPAIFSITTNTFVIYTSNIFAILGLRALYFAVIYLVDKFKYLKISLSYVLIFIGSKIFIKDLFGLEKFPPALSLFITIGILVIGVIYSIKMSKLTTQKI